MIAVDEALTRILSVIQPLENEEVPLLESHGRILAIDVKAKRTHPPFAMSAMDGYAVRSEDVVSLPCSLRIMGESAAGSIKHLSLRQGEAARIFTGAPVPEGADCIIIQENCAREGDIVLIKDGQADPGQFIRPPGLDFQKDDIGSLAGKIINARDIALMAAMNWPNVRVTRKPRIAILSTGSELVEPGNPLSSHQIVNSNSYGLAAFIHACGGTPHLLGIAKDDKEDLRQKILLGLEADLLITIGGASVGQHDLVQAVLVEEGLDLNFWKIAMRPGKPLLFGVRNKMPVLGLPGNPVSVMVTSMVFVRAIIRRMLGQTFEENKVYAKLGCNLPANDSRQDYLRASLSRSDDEILIAHPFAKQDSSMMRPLTQANCLVIRPPFAPPAQTGQNVEILIFPPGL